MGKKVAIIGFGQIGSSLGLALSENGHEVTAIDRDQATLRQAIEMGAACRMCSDPVKGLNGAELVVLAVPVGAIATMLQEISTHLKPGVVVTDVGSTKLGIVNLADSLLPPGVDFVGGHPMAGTEQKGIAGANPKLFQKAKYVLTPGKLCSAKALELLSSLVESIGAVPVIMDANRHDRAVGVVSHLPHLLAVALTQTAGDLERQQPGSLALAAGSFRDGTRVAESSPQMWQDICCANQEMILDCLQDFKSKLLELEQAVRTFNATAIGEAFAAAGQIKTLQQEQGQYGGNYTELVVAIPDEPGTLGTLAQALGSAHINIEKVQNLRSDGPGVILGFRDLKAAQQARQIIGDLGWGLREETKHGSKN